MNIALVRCSDVRSERERGEIAALCRTLADLGARVKTGRYIFDEPGTDCGKALAEELMSFFSDGETDIILDISGGDSAERLLPYLDHSLIASSKAVFWGYSDLTVIINAILAGSGKSSVLWQARNIIRDSSGNALRLFEDYLCGGDDLFDFPVKMLRGDRLEGRLAGGNLRCLLKLTGTGFFPDTQGCVILAEARSGGLEAVKGYFLRLKETGALDNAAGLLLGTFTAADRAGERAEIEKFVLSITDIPVGCTEFIGHAPDSRAARIGEYFTIKLLDK